MKDKAWPLGFKSVKPRSLIQRLALCLLLASPLASPAWALDQSAALDQAAGYFAQSAAKFGAGTQVEVEVVNYRSKKADTQAMKLETDLYHALEKKLPKFKIYPKAAVAQSLAGASITDLVSIRGTYEEQGAETLLRLTAVKGYDGEQLGSTQVWFTSKSRTRTLVAVLDIESKSLDPEQRKAMSEIFRSALGSRPGIEMASSADVDKMNPDAIQKSAQCTRDECATIIGEQLGVDRVISSSILRFQENHYILSGKIMDIKNGAILKTATVKHKGDLSTLDLSLEKLAVELAGEVPPTAPVVVVPKLEILTRPEGAEVWINGEKQDQLSPLTLTEQDPGTYEVRAIKGDLAVEETVEYKEGEARSLNLNLTAQPVPLEVESDPSGAKLFVDGQEVGTTPYEGKLLSGTHKLRLEHPDTPPKETQVALLPYQPSQVDLDLGKLPELVLEVSPADAAVYLDGKKISEGDEQEEFSPSDTFGTQTYRQTLTVGTHKLEVEHKQSLKPQVKTLKVDGLQDNYQEAVVLELDPSFVRQQQLERDQSSWAWLFTTTATGGLASLAYTATEYQKGQKAAKDYNTALEQREASGTYSEASTNYQEMTLQKEAYTKHQANSANGLAATLVFVGLGVWLWMDDGEPSAPVAWQITPWMSPEWAGVNLEFKF
ncbi:MAG: hypothetical protein A2600_04910 [Candidatus Lambdaproteobacteria bacterium RIFOXYD1_FULL_56_27]|uniref:PEGA domain-containing protein n=1 Tax=Candidatus Lambdaproteobacteria bacterium RIFOXYD2_FULL_56_26 TaxID=1817773 RepID=A0A1F6GRS5_9PROT|nr:MAG: hypothetical protein A2426_07765 [Candidatus Lambdaproteobacteria bacterium RIFOXYC1_FULL_56_13]OGH00842.1 MAG: hypothetical protein A2557_03975 [Candidatus Lambdaproteobacteria bacterium RIFOXYD2_FULL_56_26]OGH09893.1 MAG: hypothetical protein A2600_04910 [Candidatus Lambdaproteobacteria bacterium RIFOXYD1_FULL_56_27]